ncbi:MAG: T9SS type A sorting domain-containing protein, partial [Saprospiraceae bacterium]|nr:T9SS type A sorting domain-containing protein [Saprospiraceae bacterium]
TITVTASGGTGAIQFSKDNGATYASGTSPFTFSGLVSNTYQIKVKDANNCETTASSVTVGQPTALSLMTSKTDVSCNGGSNGTITVTASGGTGALQFSKDNGATYTAGTSPFTFSGLVSNTYQIKVKDANNCETTASSVTVGQPTPLSIGMVSTTPATCATGGTVTITGTTGGTIATAYTFKLSSSLTNTTGSFTNIASGSYTLTVTDDNGCSATTPVNVSNSTAPTITLDAKTDVLCKGGSTGAFTFSLSGGTSPFTTVVKDASNNTISGTGSNPYTYSNLVAGTYIFTVTDNASCTASQSVTLTEPTTAIIPSVSIAVTTGSDDVCAGTSITFTATPINGGTTPSYQWKKNGSPVGTNASTYTDATLAGGDIISCDMTSSETCATPSMANSNAITMKVTPTNVTISGTTTACSTVTLTASIVSNSTSLTYEWSGGNTPSNATNTFISSGLYGVTVTDSGTGCVGNSTVNVTILQAPTAFSLTGGGTYCVGGNGVAIGLANSESGVSYQLKKGTMNIGNAVPGTGAAISFGNQTLSGVYTVEATSTIGNCKTTMLGSATVTEPIAIVFSTPSVTNVSCMGGNSGKVVVSSTGGTGTITYAISPNIGTQSPSGTFNNLTAQTYTFTATDVNGCTKTTTATVGTNVNMPPVVTLTSPVNGETLTSSTTLTATASDPDGTIAQVNFYWVVGRTKTGLLSRQLLGSDNTAPYSYDWRNIVGGNYDIQAEAVDNCGNTTFSSISNVNVLETFTILLSSSLNGGEFVPGSNLTLTASVVAFTSRTITKVEFFAGNIKLGEDFTAPYSYVWNNVQLGNYNLRAVATDNMGDLWYSPYLFIFGANATGGDIRQLFISGSALTENNIAVNNVSVFANINGSPVAGGNVSNGFFNIATDTAENIQVRLVKNNNEDATNGVTTYDIAKVSQHILNIAPLATPYKIIAADVDRSGEIDAADMLHMRRFILRMSPSLPGGNFRFVDKAYTFRNAVTPLSETFPEVANITSLVSNTAVNFVAVKLGDVNDSYNALSPRNAGSLTFNANDMDLVAGNEYTVNISAEKMNAAAFQGTFSIEGARVKSVQAGSLNNMANGNFGLFANAVTTSWNGKAQDATDVLAITFVANKTGKLSDMLTVNSALTQAVANDAIGNEMNVHLKFNTGKVTGGEFALYQNQPNPAANETSIGFNLPKDGQARLTITTIDGRVVKIVNGEYKAGYNNISVNKSDLNASGVFYYHLETADHSASKKMVIMN